MVRFSRLLTISLLVTISVLAGVGMALAQGSNELEPLQASAFQQLKLAEQNGANVTSEVSQFNEALQLIADSRTSQESSQKLGQTQLILEAVSNSSSVKAKEAANNKTWIIIGTYGWVIVFLSVSTMFFHCILLLRRRIQIRHILKMEIETWRHEKDEA